MINGFWLFIAQLIDFLADILSLPSALLMSISNLFYSASGINNLNNGQEEDESNTERENKD